MRRLRKTFVACLLAGALAAPTATARPVEAGSVPGWRAALATLGTIGERMLSVVSGAAEWLPSEDGAVEPEPSAESGDGSDDPAVNSQNEAQPSFDPDG